MMLRQVRRLAFSADGNTISGAWEKCLNGGDWEHDFVLTYHRAD